ncbi:hypothetical protein [Persicobacter diffluens]|uniref:Transporter n=1 Tax=Persicobacter diffluens TaxID=981 RepID=A0AAN4W259_9BACT|nr:hypothetical protein PEDI_45200 [Persicobacter diffluens]
MRNLFLTLIPCLLLSLPALSQGCSDAGICTLAHLEAEQEAPKNMIGIGVAYGAADHEVSVITPYFEYIRRLNRDFSINLKLTAQSASSEVESTFGLGDLFLNVDYNFPQEATIRHGLTGGIKIPLGSTDLQGADNEALPMVFQPTLGTLDLLLGYHFGYKGFNGSILYQQPLSGENENDFDPADSNLEDPDQYPPSRKLERQGDILIRLSYGLPFGQKKWLLEPSLLPIFHLGEDKYTPRVGSATSIKGSDGLTLNGNIKLQFQPNTNHQIYFTAGSPFINRDVIPDGLLRSFVAILGYRVHL